MLFSDRKALSVAAVAGINCTGVDCGETVLYIVKVGSFSAAGLARTFCELRSSDFEPMRINGPAAVSAATEAKETAHRLIFTT